MENHDNNFTLYDEQSSFFINDYKTARQELQTVMIIANEVAIDWRLGPALRRDGREDLQGTAEKLHKALIRYTESRSAIIDYRLALRPEQLPGFESQMRLNEVDLKDLVAKAHSLYQKMTDRIISEQREKEPSPEKPIWVEQLAKVLQSMNQHTTTVQQPTSVQQPTTVIQRQPIRVPTFDGEPQNFRSYWTRFETLIDRDQTLSTAEKINLLYEGLQGKAKLLINVDPIEENYEFIKDCLHKEYGRYKTDLYSLLRKLQSVKTATYKASDCDTTFREIQALLRQMESVGSRATKETCLGQVLPKFPFEIVGDIIMEADRMTADQILETLHDKIVRFKLKEERESFHKGEYPASLERNRSYTNTCIFCGRSNHMSSKCRTFASISERRDQIKKKNLCWNCFSNKHNSRNCTQAKCRNCQQDHNILLCNKTMDHHGEDNKSKKPLLKPKQQQLLALEEGYEEPEQTDSYNYRIADDSSDESEPIMLSNVDKPHKGQKVILKTAEVMAYNHKRKRFECVNAIIDEGSMRSLITEEYAERLGLPVKGSMTKTFYGIGCVKNTHSVNEVPILLRTDSGKIELMLNTKPSITVAVTAPILTKEDRKFINYEQYELANSKTRGESFQPHLLIGLDCYNQITGMHTMERILPSGLFIRNTIFGGIVYGATSYRTQTKAVSLFISNTEETRELTPAEVANKLFSIDNLGIDFQEEEKAEITMQYYEEYSAKIVIKDRRITAPFPVTERINTLQDNKKVAMRRIHCLRTQLERNPDQNKWYTKIMGEYIKNGIVEKVPRNDDALRTYYIPHHGVWRHEKPKPLRIVFDASSKARGSPSLNEVIATGSIFINKIHDILMENRFHKIVIMCDIEAAFTQIRLTESDKDLCRFFWLEEDENGKNKIEAYRFCRLPFGVTTSPSILNMCLTKFLSDENSALAKQIMDLLYVDNISIGATTPTEAIERYKETKELFSKISMNVREFISNDEKFNSRLPEADRLNQTIVKMLGVPFNTKTDELTAFVKLEKQGELTKRIMLSQLHKSFDPIGLISPLTLKMKLMLRDVFALKSGWDEVLTDEVTQLWNEMLEDITPARVNVERYIPLYEKSVLWIFADASQAATAVCAYVQTDHIISNLLIGKVKLAPKRKLTIPKLELIAFRLATTLALNFKLKTQQTRLRRIKLVTDSHIALDWLCSTKKLSGHVTQQIAAVQKTINRLTDMGCNVDLYHVTTDYNPADIGTRGSSKRECQNSMWVKGPQWLSHKRTPLTKFEIPNFKPGKDPVEEGAITLLNPEEEINEEILEECLKTSNHRHNMRKTAFIGKFLNAITKNRSIKMTSIRKFSSERDLTAEDYKTAKRFLIAQAQREINITELQEKFCRWHIFQDTDRIIRISTRLQNAELPYNTKNPIWLPRKSVLARYIINQTHLKMGHQGRDVVSMAIKRTYYMQKTIATIKGVLKTCTRCRRFQGLPFGSPRMADLPADRVRLGKPFENCGCDLMGPFCLQDERKVHACLFTCMATRAIHLEVVYNTSAEAFLNAFQRFTARRGVPKLMRSDNGSNFVLGNKILSKIVSHNEIRNNAYKRYIHHYHLDKIKWMFNTPLAPWKGGAWERLIGIVKSVLYKVMGRYKPTYDELHTAFVKIETLVNSRPLTFPDPSDPESQPIRPIDFLSTQISYSVPDYIDREMLYDEDYDPDQLKTAKEATEAMKFLAKVTERFWQRWHKEYLVTIKDINKVLRNQGRNKQAIPKIGEIVLIKAENVPRGAWRLGRITKLLNHTDGFIRSVEMKSRSRLIERSLDQVYPLELCSPEYTENDNPIPEEHIPYEGIPTTERVDPSEQPEQRLESEPINDNFDYEIDAVPETNEEPQLVESPEQETSMTVRIERDAIKQCTRTVRSFFQKGKTESHVPTKVQTITHAALQPNRMKELLAQRKARDERQAERDRKARPPNLLSLVMLTCIALSFIPAVMAGPQIYCRNSTIFVQPDSRHLLVCADAECHTIPTGMNRTQQYKLKAIPGKVMVDVRMISEQGTETIRCIREHVCSKATFMSKNLLGNPGCWPAGAQVSLFLMITLVLAVLLPIIRWAFQWIITSNVLSKARKNWDRTKSIAHSIRALNAPREPEFEMVTISRPQLRLTSSTSRTPETSRSLSRPRKSRHRSPLPLPVLAEYQEVGTATSYDLPTEAEYANMKPEIPPHTAKTKRVGGFTKAAMFTLILCFIIPQALTCQDAHIRQLTELKCDNRTNCYYQFGKEFMFNAVTTKLCVLMMHNNAVIGTIEVEKINSTMECIKQHEFYTRVTSPEVRTSKRCWNTGSCTEGFCESVKSTTLINEFSAFHNYSGQSGCTTSCGGWFCGCGFLSDACSFHRLYHKPTTDEVFDVYKCADYMTTTSFKVRVIMRKKLTEYEFRLAPYTKETTHHFNATIISQTNQYTPILNNRFATSNKRTIMLDEGSTFMIKCKSAQEAQERQLNCTTNRLCNCLTNEETTKCSCPENALILHQKQQTLPFANAIMEIQEENHTVVALQKNEEILFYLESNLFMDSASMNLDYPCAPAFVNITGCYDCPTGAKINIGCMSSIDTWVTIQCGDQVRSIECAPSNPATTITMYFHEATVSQSCHTMCDNTRKELTIEGTLHYHELEDEYNESIDRERSYLPDLKPLKSVLWDRWKSTLFLLGASLVTTLSAYAFGAQALTALSKPLIWACIQISALGWRVLIAFFKAIF